MSALNQIRVGPRLMLGFGVVLVFLVVTLLIGLSRMAIMQANLDEIVRHDYAEIMLVNTMRDAVRFRDGALRDVVLQEDFAFKRGGIKRMREAQKRYKDADAALAKLVLSPAGMAMLENIRQSEARSSEQVSAVIDATLSEDPLSAQAAIRDKVRPAQIELIARLDEMLARLEADSLSKAQSAEQTYQSARLFMSGLGLLAIVFGGLIALLITRSLTGCLAGQICSNRKPLIFRHW
jgi:methyl-accepting chemotaxis protein